eukprot:15335576-Ditylum_brightwellii.AAC.1
MYPNLWKKKQVELTSGGYGGREHFRSQSAKEAENLSRFSSLGTSDQGNTQEDNEIADEVTTKMTNTTTGEGDNLIVSSSELKEMTEEYFVCGACVEEDDMAIVDAIAERSKVLCLSICTK